MNNKEFIAKLAQTSGYNQELTQEMVLCLLEEMAQIFDEGESVVIPLFGTFEVKKRMERLFVNPSTGKKMLAPPKLTLGFRPSTIVKEQLKKGDNV